METDLVIVVILLLSLPALLVLAYLKTRSPRRTAEERLEIDHAALESAERRLQAEGDRDWVVLKRCHGPAYSHTAMSEIVVRLGEAGIEATYDVIGTSSAEGGITNFMLKVLRGQEARATDELARWEAGD